MLTGRLSLEEFLIEERKRHAHASGDLNGLIFAIARSCKLISRQLASGRLAGPAAPASADENPARLQETAQTIFNRLVQSGGRLAGMLSRSAEQPISLPDGAVAGKYLLLFDPLEGADNLDVGVPAGSIFSIIRAREPGARPAPEDFLRPGTEQVCAGYAIYGPATMLVLTVGTGTQGFTLDPLLGEFVLTHPGIKIAERTRDFSINPANKRFWPPAIRRYVDECVAGESGPRNGDFNMRWVASLVAETHRILMRGGVLLNPMEAAADRPDQAHLLYEANPIAFILEQASGRAITGHRRILDLEPTSLHQEVALIFGSTDEVERIARYHEETDDDYDAPLFGVRGLFRD